MRHLRTGSTRALLPAALAGTGVALPALFARRAGLAEVPAPRPLPARSPWLVARRDMRPLPAVKAVHGWIVETLSALARPAP